jgi:hypothetical protein
LEPSRPSRSFMILSLSRNCFYLFADSLFALCHRPFAVAHSFDLAASPSPRARPRRAAAPGRGAQSLFALREHALVGPERIDFGAQRRCLLFGRASAARATLRSPALAPAGGPGTARRNGKTRSPAPGLRAASAETTLRAPSRSGGGSVASTPRRATAPRRPACDVRAPNADRKPFALHLRRRAQGFDCH